MKKSMLAALLGKGGEQDKTLSMGSVLGTGGAVLAGGGGTYAANAIVGRVAALQGKPYAAPIGMVVLGHLLKRVSPAAGYALIGAGSAIGMINKMSGAGPAPAGDVPGAGAVVESRNAGAVVNAGRDTDDDDGADEADAGAVVRNAGTRFGDAGMLIDN